jgi:hypothetical protein
MPRPDAKDNAKMTGDIHPPEVESDLPVEEGSSNAAGATETPRDRGKAGERGAPGRPGRGIKKAGLLKDKGDQTSDGSGEAPDAGDGSDGNRA